MPDVNLLSNGRYHVMVTAGGCGWSHWHDMAVTRWREDAALDDWGTLFFMRDRDDSAVWSAARPSLSASAHEIAAATTIAVAADDDVELRRLRLANLSSRRRTLSVTSYSEIVLSPAATDKTRASRRFASTSRSTRR
jgi:cellobiose phosphorylase